ncbi:flagellar protein FliT [Brevibacillus marinus]|uniref:flagellar protein FliT n=1 Tax=Brevibacillus marinus TaxID=2496837 RepID=UPI000F82C0E0|nr:flagellar protein FliT [Brevibacillus marinus]
MSSLSSLCERLLETTLELEALVNQPDSDAELWGALLEEREGIMSEISRMLSAGEALSPALREQYVAKADEANRRIFSQMTARKDALYEQMIQLQRAKQVRRQYANLGPNGYGAFFDKRK